MNKFNSELEFPALFDLVLVFYKQGKGEGWATCYSVGYWNGTRWYRPSIQEDNKMTSFPLNNVEGWEHIQFQK